MSEACGARCPIWEDGKSRLRCTRPTGHSGEHEIKGAYGSNSYVSWADGLNGGDSVRFKALFKGPKKMSIPSSDVRGRAMFAVNEGETLEVELITDEPA